MQGMGVRSVAPPKLRQVKQTVTLPKAAKLRVSWMDYYQAHGRNAALTARHFGISKSCFFKWKARFDKQGLVGLLDQPKRPKNVRVPLTPEPVASAIKQLRKANPEFSKYKLAVILKRDYGYRVSASTVGRVIARIRKPHGFAPARPGDLVEVDVKHLPHINGRRYGFVAIDVVTKRACVHVGSTISATQGALAWRKAVRQLGLPRAVLTDNGSENLGAFAALLQEQQLPQYFARPHTPKDKPHVERFIGSLERECIQWGGVVTDQADQQAVIDDWLKKYHSYRPHQALGYLTPDEYEATLHT